MHLGETKERGIEHFLRSGNWQKSWKPLLLVAALSFVTILSGCTGVVTAGSGTGTLQLNPATVSFGNVGVGKSSSQTVTISNGGTAALTVTQATVSNGQFKVSGVTFPMSMAAGQSGSMTVSVTPTTSGPVNGTLSVQGDAGTAPVVVNLAATGVAASQQISLSSSSVNFGSIVVGSQGASSLTISNTGGSDLTISGVAIAGTGFGFSGITTPKVISAGQSSAVSLSFSPTTAAAATGSLTITSNDPANPTMTVALSGTGTAAPTGTLQANQSSLSFGNVGTGTSSVKQITLTNTGTGSLQITGITVSGTGLTTSGVAVPATLSPSSQAVLSVTFAPTAVGAVTGTVTVTSNGTGSPLAIPVSGTGVQAGLTISPSSFNFGSVIDGQTKSQAFTITNSGTAALTISQVSINAPGYSVNGLSSTSVAVGGTATFNAVFAPTTAGNLAGTVNIASNAPNSPATVALSGTGVAVAQTLSFSSSSLAFGNVNTGSSSTKNVTVTNTGNTNVQVSSITVSGTGYTLTGVSVPTTLTPSQTLTFGVVFTPSAAGASTGSVTVTSNATGSPATISLSGTGAQAGLTVSPTSFSFGSVVDGQTKSQAFTITNSGTASLTISQVSITAAGYSVNGLSATTLAPGATATFNAVFAPTTAGTLAGTVNIASNAPNSPTTVALSGTGVAATQTVSFSSSSLAFGNVNTGSSSTKNVTITNTGNTNVQVSSIAVSGAGYTLTGVSVPATLTPSQTLTFGVVFTPSGAGSSSGSVTVTSNASGSPATISLSGTGAQAGLTVSPASFSFGSVVDGQTKSQSFTITNSGTASLTISQLSISAVGYTVNGLSIPSTVAAGASVTFNAVFAPTTAGSLTGTVSIVSNAPNSPTAVSLSGTGVAVTQTLSYSSTSLAFGSVNTGTSSTQNLTITNTGNSSVQISSITVSGAGYSLSGAGSQVTLNPSQTLTFSVIFTPGTTGTLNGTVTVTSNATGSPKTISLSGTGAQVVSHTVSLTWSESGSGISGFNVYRTTTSGSGYTKINATLVPTMNYTDSSVQNTTTYFYVTTAVDANGNESGYSNEASAIVP
jgi:hypothetical protein